MNRADRHLAGVLADAFGVTARWMRELRRRQEEGEERRPVGRPRIGEAERARVRGLVEEERARQGEVGERPILAGIRRRESAGELLGRASTTLVREALASIKEEARTRARRAIEAAREGHDLLARDAVWSGDSTHVGRMARRAQVDAEILKDRGSTKTLCASVGGPSTAASVREDLERTAKERGGYPLVYQTDRAGIYAALLEDLDAERVILLRSRPHTPTDNAAVECLNRELKEETGLGKGVTLHCALEAAARLAPAMQRIDAGRLRGTRGYLTAEELDAAMPRADALVDRGAFYAVARSAMREAVLGLVDVTEIAQAEHQAVWRVLERFELARSRRGRQMLGNPNRAAAPATQKG